MAQKVSKAVYQTSALAVKTVREDTGESIFSLSLLANDIKINLGAKLRSQLDDLGPHLNREPTRFLLKKDKDKTISHVYYKSKIGKENLLVLPQVCLVGIFDRELLKEFDVAVEKLTRHIVLNNNSSEESVTWPLGTEIRDDFEKWSGGLRYFLKLSNYHSMRQEMRTGGEELDYELTAQIGYVKGELEGFRSGQITPSGVFTCTCTEMRQLIQSPAFRRQALDRNGFDDCHDDDDEKEV